MTFWDGIFLTIVGFIGLYMGFTNKKTTIWGSFTTYGRKKLTDPFPQLINIIAGLLCSIIGILLLIKRR